jgi:hypothetical protein
MPLTGDRALVLVDAPRCVEAWDAGRLLEGGILHCLRVGASVVIGGCSGLTFLSLLLQLLLAVLCCLSAND